FWSVPFWFFFEAYNLRLKNWYYVFALRSTGSAAVVTALAFATVLPACFFHAELVRALGWFDRVRCRRLRVNRGVLRFMLFCGILSIAAPLLLPGDAFWLVWGATLWIPTVVNYRAGALSLLADLESGRCRRMLCLLVGGLLAGVVRETLNHWARCKWIYTVPGFEGWKLFEMPLLGFGGFPVLALGAFGSYSMVCHFLRGGRSWEVPGRQTVRAGARGRYAAAVFSSVLASVLVGLGTMQTTIRSRRPLLGELEGLSPQSVARLRSAGIPTPERLYRAIHAEGVAAVALRTSVQTGRLGRAYRHAALALHKGMGPQAAELLQAAGISSVADLVSADPRDLFDRLCRVADGQHGSPPRLAEVAVWVRAARNSGTPRR
ncbi:MAG TPA: DUF4332 domain-containing protein, partial [Thermoanaerobaculia bacterium]|nr:DUF4332 domain-containing protein [Thermoanaerobaculia bacterium]